MIWEILLITTIAGEVLFADVLLLPNGMSKVGSSDPLGLLALRSLIIGHWLTDGLFVRGCRDAGKSRCDQTKSDAR